ncbi:MAG: peptidoglycan-binding domain-containing protein [Candidatus Micrarchaeota archaeon]
MVLRSREDEKFDKAQAWYGRHPEVSIPDLQKVLVALKYLDRGHATGQFNRETYEAVKTAQIEYNKGRKRGKLVEDGMYGNNTSRAIMANSFVSNDVPEPTLVALTQSEQKIVPRRVERIDSTSRENRRRGELAAAARMEPGTKGPEVLTPEAYKARLTRIVERGYDIMGVQKESDNEYVVTIALDARKREMLEVTILSETPISAVDMKQTVLDLIENDGAMEDRRIEKVWVLERARGVDRETELYSYSPRNRRTNLTAFRSETGEKLIGPGRTYLAYVGDYLEKYDKKS